MCYGQEINSALRAARKRHTCHWCGERIEPKTKYFYWFGIVDGDTSHTKVHPECQAVIDENVRPGTCWIPFTGQPRGAYNSELETVTDAF